MESATLTVSLFLEVPHPCPYLADEAAVNLRFNLDAAAPPLVDTLLARGFRHFGNDYFRPACPGCDRCVSLRIPVADFAPNRSQQRTLALNSDLRWSWNPVSVDAERLALLEAFQVDRAATRGWPLQVFSADDYRRAFFWDERVTHEMTVRDAAGRLVAVGIADLTGTALSGIYHYHDPAEKRRSLGTWMIMQQLLWARATGRSWHYLGLWNRDAVSLTYKARFFPHEILDPAGNWHRIERSRTPSF